MPMVWGSKTSETVSEDATTAAIYLTPATYAEISIDRNGSSSVDQMKVSVLTTLDASAPTYDETPRYVVYLDDGDEPYAFNVNGPYGFVVKIENSADSPAGTVIADVSWRLAA